MPLTGALQADFSDFVNEANKASAALGVMDTEAKKTGQTMAKTGAAMDGFGEGAGKGTNSVAQLTTGLRSIDGSMNALGVSISKPVALIEELGQVSGKTYTQLGLLGSAGVALGVAMAGLELGKWIGEITNMDETARNLQQRFLGWGDAADRAANAAAVLALATKNAGRPITDLTEAMDINYKAMKQHSAEVGTAINRQASWEREIRKNRAALPEMMAALENHTATVKQLSEQYHMSADAIQFYIAKTKDQTSAQDEATRKAEAAAEAQKKLRDQMFGTGTITQANEYIAALGGMQNLTRMTQDEQTKLNTVLGEAIDAYARMGQTAPAALNEIYLATLSIGKVTTGLGTEWGNVGTKFTPTADEIIGKIQGMTDKTKAYEAETQRLVDEAQRIKPPIDQAKQAVDDTTAAAQRLTVQMQDFGRVNRSAWESMQAGAELMKGYQDAGIFVGMQGGAMTGYQAQQRQRMATETPTGGNTLNVNVNSTEAGDISRKLVEEMRRNGVRF